MTFNEFMDRSVRRSVSLLVALLFCGLFSSTHAQQEAASSGDELDAGRADNAPIEADEEALSAEEEEALLQRAREIEARQASIMEIQSELGIYDASLIEAYGDLAAIYMEAEDWASAIATYNSALQIARISHGLNSESQLPVIQDLIASNTGMKDWQAIDDLQHLALHIGRRLYAFDDSDYLGSLNQFGDWKLRVLKENLLSLSGGGMMNVASELSDFYGAAIDQATLNQLPASAELLQLNYGKAMTDIELSRAIARTHYSYFQGTVSPYISQRRCSVVPNSQGQAVRRCTTVQVENPRYRRSQADAKRFELSRRNREVADSLDTLRRLLTTVELSRDDREQLESQIRQIEAEMQGMRRNTGRPSLF